MEGELSKMSEREHINKSELVRRALLAYLGQQAAEPRAASALDKAGDLVGCFSGGAADLSFNPSRLQGFGTNTRSR
jgi:Ribbon-helix-helix protein, copG family